MCLFFSNISNDPSRIVSFSFSFSFNFIQVSIPFNYYEISLLSVLGKICSMKYYVSLSLFFFLSISFKVSITDNYYEISLLSVLGKMCLKYYVSLSIFAFQFHSKFPLQIIIMRFLFFPFWEKSV